MGTAKIAQTTTSTMLLMMMTTTTMLHAVLAQEGPASTPAPSQPDSITILLGLSDCLTYVKPGSKLTKPDKPCCPELAGLVKNNPICLCSLLDNSTSSNLSIQIDVNRALKLPTVCKVQTPPASYCSLVGIRVEAPTGSEAPAPSQGSKAPAPSPSSGSSAITPPGTNNKSGAFLAGIVIALLPILF